MQFRIFQYPLPCDPEPADLNRFLSENRIASVNHYMVQDSGMSVAVFIVATANASLAGSASATGVKESNRVDYQKILSPDEFDLFSRLRDERRRIAESDGIPVYAVFTNSQLAEMVRARMDDIAGLLRIEGIGQAKAEKFGPAMIRLLQSP